MADKVDAPTGSDAGSVPKDHTGTGPKAVVKNVDMSEEMQQEAVDVASAALEKYNIEKDIAAQIKKEFDRRYGPTWHAVVGKNFGSYVTHGASSSTLLLSAVRVCAEDGSRGTCRRSIGYRRCSLRSTAIFALLHSWLS